MQSYLNGFHPGDPRIHPLPADAETWTPHLDEEVDVLIVGTGPAGLVLAAQLARFPDIRTRIIERREGALQMGQADGVACRSMEMFKAFGISDRILAEAYGVNETVFWRPDPETPDQITRSGRVRDVEEGLSEFPHVILNQARVQDFLLESMRDSPTRLEPDYGWEFVSLDARAADEPVTVTVRDAAGSERTIRAQYVVGCDGARSAVRAAIGRTLEGDALNQAWGVMDVLAVTDFPDIRFKAVIQSREAGNMIIIPREGGYLVRLYIELDELAPGERVRGRQVTADDVLAVARRILSPHTLDVKEVVWWSVYEIGQRLTDRFDNVEEGSTTAPRVFVAGDACHTHSPKAGQGMNVSMQDAFNLGWKLAAVLQGRSTPALLHTYSAERHAIAQRLITFDREWAAMMSAHPDSVTPARLQENFQQQGRYTAGVATRYASGPLVGPDTWQHLAPGLGVGERFHSVPVLRLADAQPMHLGHAAEADGRWRLYAFADATDLRESDSRLAALCRHLLEDAPSPIRRFTPAGSDLDALFDVRAVLQQSHRELDAEALPDILRPPKGRHGLVDYEKAFTADPDQPDPFALRGIDRSSGCLIVVRPDQYIAHVLPLDAYDALAEFFEAVLLPAS